MSLISYCVSREWFTNEGKPCSRLTSCQFMLVRITARGMTFVDLDYGPKRASGRSTDRSNPGDVSDALMSATLYRFANYLVT